MNNGKGRGKKSSFSSVHLSSLFFYWIQNDITASVLAGTSDLKNPDPYYCQVTKERNKYELVSSWQNFGIVFPRPPHDLFVRQDILSLSLSLSLSLCPSRIPCSWPLSRKGNCLFLLFDSKCNVGPTHS